MNGYFKNKTILITGGTGYLGRALTKELLKYNPKSIRLLGRDEFKHYKVQELFKNNPKLRHFIGDIRDYGRLLKATRLADIVIHAAALKRIDLLEYNVEEAIKTNIMGTLNVVNACLANNVEKAVFVSTDKACAPVNTYGACKFVSERIFSESNYSKGNLKTVFTCVRYGNVLESTGSVIPTFTEKIKKGDKIPLTDSEMTRFVISPQESVELIFNAIKHAYGGEIFVPILKSFKIVDLIKILKEKYKAKNGIKIIGVRPGEKIHELLINKSEIPRSYKYKNFYVIASCIEKLSGKTKPDYIKNGKELKSLNIKEYSSKNYLMTRLQIKKVFKKLKLI